MCMINKWVCIGLFVHVPVSVYVCLSYDKFSVYWEYSYHNFQSNAHFHDEAIIVLWYTGIRPCCSLDS